MIPSLGLGNTPSVSPCAFPDFCSLEVLLEVRLVLVLLHSEDSDLLV